jgi:hypothetical protein
MDNIILFVCGLAVTLLSGMGVLVYMVHVGYEHQKETTERKKAEELRVKEKVDADLGGVEPGKNPNMDSFVGIPSVS